MPATLFTLPRELRDEILAYAALSSSFAFLRTCRQLNEEGTPLLYKHAVYDVRILMVRREGTTRQHLRAPKNPPPFHLVQNLYITLPPRWSKIPNYEIPPSAIALLEQFRGTEIRRRVCHFDLQAETLSAEIVKGLGGLVGFEVVRVQMRLRLYDRNSHREPECTDVERHYCMQLIDERLGPALGKAKWETKESVMLHERVAAVLVAEFRPWSFTS